MMGLKFFTNIFFQLLLLLLLSVKVSCYVVKKLYSLSEITTTISHDLDNDFNNDFENDSNEEVEIKENLLIKDFYFISFSFFTTKLNKTQFSEISSVYAEYFLEFHTPPPELV